MQKAKSKEETFIDSDTARALQVDWELVTSDSAFPAPGVLRLLSGPVRHGEGS